MLDINPEVENALKHGQPVVALESTIITHGMPYPENVQTALKVENVVRENGAMPATIAIIGGRMKAGLNPDEIELLGRSGPAVIKTSRRDLPYIISKKLNGATTVASTMIIAAKAGIGVFATGGIGGVHRGAETNMDISADLQELARTSVAVVSAGAKAILDLPKTLEYLETYGVPVLGYKTNEFPAFYSRKSGLGVDFRLDSPEEIARFLRVKWEMELRGGVLIANPIPQDREMEHEQIQQIIEQAVAEAEQRGIKGKEITPFLLGRIVGLTEGASLRANVELVLNNARLASRVARAYNE